MGTSALTSSSQIQTDYMKLLVTQLQNQNPLEPMTNDQMAAQLAQCSQLEQLESMNSTFAKVLVTVEQDYAASLIGKEVTFLGEIEPDVVDVVNGTVEQVYNNTAGEVVLAVGSYSIGLTDVISVKD